MNYYNEIKNELINNEINRKVKSYSINKSDLNTYYNVGKLLLDEGNQYGESIIKEYSLRLTEDLGPGYSQRNLRNMRQFYKVSQKWQTVSAKLSWSHYSELLSIKDENELIYYISIAYERNLSKRELREKIKNKEYERLPIKTKKKLTLNDEIEAKDLVPNPILIKNKNNIEIISEKALHNLILEDIESFMKELGNSFCFIGSEYKIKIGDRNYHIDLLLFNIKFNCYVVVELKITEFKSEYISQVQKYMNYIDKNIKEPLNNNTMGILICKKENKFVIEYCSDEIIAVRKYEFV